LSRLHLLDTNVISDLIKQPRGPIFDRIVKVGADNVCTSAIAAAELQFGAARKRDIQLTRTVQDILSEIEVLPFDHLAAQEYGRLRTALQAEGVTLEANDLLIAAHANAVDATLVTADAAFEQLGKLAKIQNWR
jgi:tRNA(fMet)-specific endonuclease VapC